MRNETHGQATVYTDMTHSEVESWKICSWKDHTMKDPIKICCQINKNPPTSIAFQPAIMTTQGLTKNVTVNGTNNNELLRKLTYELMEEALHKVKMPQDVRQEGLTCGKSVLPSSKNFSLGRLIRRKRIVNGFPSSALTHPWMATVFFRGKFLCGATIISNRVIVTAAHCVRHALFKDKKGKDYTSLLTSKYEIMVGTSKLGHGIMYKVSRIIVPEKYHIKMIYYDIAVLFTQQSIMFSESVQPICLPTSYMTTQWLEGMTASMVGFGTFSFGKKTFLLNTVTYLSLVYLGGPLPENLQETNVWIQSNKVCNAVYQKLSRKIFPQGIPVDSLLCTGGGGMNDTGTTDACQVSTNNPSHKDAHLFYQGDSGGPLILSHEGRAYLVGVISFGYKCLQKGFYGVSTSVTHFLPWISKVVSAEQKVY